MKSTTWTEAANVNAENGVAVRCDDWLGGIAKIEGGNLILRDGAVCYSRTPEDWIRLAKEEWDTRHRLEQMERELGRCQPDRWLEKARAELAEKANEADLARADATGRARSMMVGQAQAYRDALGVLKAYAA